MTPKHFNTPAAIPHLLVLMCHNPQYVHSNSPSTTMTEMSCKIQRFSFSLTLPRMCWRKLREGKKNKMLKKMINLDVPSTLKSQLKHSEPSKKTPCAAAPLFENINNNQVKDIRIISPVGRRRSENHCTSTPISLSIKHKTRKARMLPTYKQGDMDGPGFKIYDVMDDKYKDIWGS